MADFQPTPEEQRSLAIHAKVVEAHKAAILQHFGPERAKNVNIGQGQTDDSITSKIYATNPQEKTEYLSTFYNPETGEVIEHQLNESMQNKKLYNKVLLNISESDYNQAKINLEKIFEAKLRARISNSLKQVDEGLFDRLGARAAGLGAGLKAKAQNFGTRVGSSVKAIGQNVAGAATGKGFTTGQATVDAANKDIAANDPRKAAKAAQANNIIASFAKDLSTLYPSINPQKLLSNLRTQLNLAKP